MKNFEGSIAPVLFNLSGQEASFVGFLTSDPSLIWNTDYCAQCNLATELTETKGTYFFLIFLRNMEEQLQVCN